MTISRDPRERAPDGKSWFDVEGAHATLLTLAGVLAIPAVLIVLVFKGLVAAFVVAGLAIGLWLQIAALIPTERELASMA